LVLVQYSLGMCIVANWSATKVAKLALVFESIGLSVGVHVLSSNARMKPVLGPSMIASAAAVIGLGLMILSFNVPKKRSRVLPLVFILAALPLHGLSSFGTPRFRSVFTREASALCAAAADSQLDAGKLDGLLASPLSSQAARDKPQAVTEAVQALIEKHESIAKQFREARKISVTPEMLEGQRRKWCESGMLQAVLGSMTTQLEILGTCNFVSGLLAFLTASLIWCEDYPSGEAFRLKLFPAEDAHAKRTT